MTSSPPPSYGFDLFLWPTTANITGQIWFIRLHTNCHVHEGCKFPHHVLTSLSISLDLFGRRNVNHWHGTYLQVSQTNSALGQTHPCIHYMSEKVSLLTPLFAISRLNRYCAANSLQLFVFVRLYIYFSSTLHLLKHRLNLELGKIIQTYFLSKKNQTLTNQCPWLIDWCKHTFKRIEEQIFLGCRRVGGSAGRRVGGSTGVGITRKANGNGWHRLVVIVILRAEERAFTILYYPSRPHRANFQYSSWMVLEWYMVTLNGTWMVLISSN